MSVQSHPRASSSPAGSQSGKRRGRTQSVHREGPAVRSPDSGRTERSIAPLMERIHRGERAAMDDLIRRFWEPLVSYAQEIVEGPDDAEDVVQSVFLKVWERRTEWTPTDRLLAFLYRITRNEALNQRRSRSTRFRLLKRLSMASARPSTTPPESLERSDLAREVSRAIDDLPPRRREIFMLARFHGRSYREIAEILDISPQTVANQLSSARAQLRVSLRRVYRELRPEP